MRKFLMLMGALALLLASWIMPAQTAEAGPSVCNCSWCGQPNNYNDCWHLEEEIWYSCEGYYYTHCQP